MLISILYIKLQLNTLIQGLEKEKHTFFLIN